MGNKSVHHVSLIRLSSNLVLKITAEDFALRYLTNQTKSWGFLHE